MDTFARMVVPGTEPGVVTGALALAPPPPRTPAALITGTAGH